MVPVIKGPGGEPYLTDHHHLARALYEEGVKSVYITVIADLSRLPKDHFWNMMDFHGWTHPYDSKGCRREYSDLPKTIKMMEDDPYRSLAGLLRTHGASPRIQRHSRNFCGPISCGRESRPRPLGPTSAPR
jgi:hypothetical protein